MLIIVCFQRMCIFAVICFTSIYDPVEPVDLSMHNIHVLTMFGVSIINRRYLTDINHKFYSLNEKRSIHVHIYSALNKLIYFLAK